MSLKLGCPAPRKPEEMPIKVQTGQVPPSSTWLSQSLERSFTKPCKTGEMEYCSLGPGLRAAGGPRNSREVKIKKAGQIHHKVRGHGSTNNCIWQQKNSTGNSCVQHLRTQEHRANGLMMCRSPGTESHAATQQHHHHHHDHHLIHHHRYHCHHHHWNHL